MTTLLSRLGLTEGQRYTLAIGLVLGLVTAAIGIPPTLRDRPEAAAFSVPAAGQAALPGGGEAASVPPPTHPTPPPPARAPVPPMPSPTPTTAPAETPRPVDERGGGPTDPPADPEFADGGSLGDVVALATVADPGAPSGIAVDASTGAFYVATDNGADTGASEVQRFSATGALDRELAVEGQVSPRARGLTGVVVDGAGNVYALDAAAGHVVRVDATTNAIDVFATIPDVGVCTADRAGRCELSLRDATPLPQAVTLGTDGSLYVADAGQAIVWRVDRFGSPTVWAKSTDFLAADGAGPSGIAFDPEGDLIVAVRTSLIALTGAVYRIPVGDDGSAGPPSELHRTAPNDGPAGLAVGASGRIYVALSGIHAVAVLEGDGTPVTTITGPSLSAPTGVAFRGASLLVTNRAAATVVRLPVEDRVAEAS